MIRQAHTSILLSTSAFMLALSLNTSAAVDVDGAKELARANNCFKCHGIDKEKDGPAWKKVAEKYRGKPDAEAKLIHHITSGEKVKFPDGHQEEHKNIQGKASPESIKNLVDFILSL
jgi:cytochrome c